ncbi:hypothetical protein ACJRO7_024547 [Eucalyptus globulus]|uniref:RNA helicase n=1 Tax=Eucalyptus globulus TaxID=34317 RepID=A0ABD3K8Z8_EUCGL
MATPNSELSEEALKKLGTGGFSESEVDASEDEGGFMSEGGEAESVSEDELALSKLGFASEAHWNGEDFSFRDSILKHLTDGDEHRSLRCGRLPRVLALAPTRELAKQVEKEIKESTPYLNTVCVYGGVSYITQQSVLSQGFDVVVRTPGRIIDLINGNSLKLGEVEFLVLDEVDQIMLFSATMPGWVKKLVRKHLNNPLTIDLVGEQDEKLAEGIKIYAISATPTSKRTILSDLITINDLFVYLSYVYAKGRKTIVFTQTKRDADEVSMALTSIIASEALHGDISQHQRERTLNGFRQRKFTVLVATDVASHGLDIPNVDLIGYLVIHYELPNDSETFVHRSVCTGCAGKEGMTILMYTSSVGCTFEFISPPAMREVLESSAEQVVATLKAVHPKSLGFFTPTAQKLIEERGVNALADALAHLSGFWQPPTSRSLTNHEQGWVTLQLTRDPSYSRGFLSARSVTGFLSDVYSPAADELGKIYLVADERVQVAVFDLPEEIAKELLSQLTPPGNTITRISKVMMDPLLISMVDFLAETGVIGQVFRDRRGSRSSQSWGSGRDADDDVGLFRRGGRGSRIENSWSRPSRNNDNDWLIGGRRSSRPSSRDRSFGGLCFVYGRAGHRASECPSKQDY